MKIQILPFALVAVGCMDIGSTSTRDSITGQQAAAVTNSVTDAAGMAAASAAEIKKILSGVELTPAARLAVEGHLEIITAVTGAPTKAQSESAAALTAAADIAKYRAAVLEAERANESVRRELERARSEAEKLREERDQLRKDKESDAKVFRDRAFYALAALIALLSAVGAGLGAYLGRPRLIVAGAAFLCCAAAIGFIPQFLGSAAFLRMQTALAWTFGGVVGVVIVGGGGFLLYESIKWVRESKASAVIGGVVTGIKKGL